MIRLALFVIGIAVPLSLSASTTLAADGAALYKQNCASCHGDNGNSDTAVGKAMKVPHLASVDPTVETVLTTVRENPKHKSVASKVSDEDLAAIAAHIATLD